MIRIFCDHHPMVFAWLKQRDADVVDVESGHKHSRGIIQQFLLVLETHYPGRKTVQLLEHLHLLAQLFRAALGIAQQSLIFKNNGDLVAEVTHRAEQLRRKRHRLRAAEVDHTDQPLRDHQRDHQHRPGTTRFQQRAFRRRQERIIRDIRDSEYLHRAQGVTGRVRGECEALLCAVNAFGIAHRDDVHLLAAGVNQAEAGCGEWLCSKIDQCIENCNGVAGTINGARGFVLSFGEV